MLPGPSRTARRFYAQFYRWSLLLQPRQCVLRREYHVALSLRDGAVQTLPRTNSTAGVKATRRLRPGQAGRGGGARGRLGPFQGNHGDHSNLLVLPVQTSTEKPFRSFKSWEKAIRYRSDMGIMIEFGLPVNQALHLAKVYGPRLEGLARECGGRVGLGAVTANDDGRNSRSVLVSGTFEAAQKALIIMNNLRMSRLSTDEQPSGDIHRLPPSIARPSDWDASTIQALGTQMTQAQPTISQIQVESTRALAEQATSSTGHAAPETQHSKSLILDFPSSRLADFQHELGKRSRDRSQPRYRAVYVTAEGSDNPTSVTVTGEEAAINRVAALIAEISQDGSYERLVANSDRAQNGPSLWRAKNLGIDTFPIVGEDLRPIEAIQHWETVVRSRKAGHVVFDVGIPRDILISLVKIFGPSLSTISILTECEFRVISELDDDAKNTGVVRWEGNIKQMQPVIAKMELYRYIDYHARVLVQQSKGYHRLSGWTSWAVVSHDVTPAANLEEWRFLMRQAAWETGKSDWVMEFVVPQRPYRDARLDGRSTRAYVEHLAGAKVIADEAFTESRCVLTIRGSQEQIYSAYEGLLLLKTKVKGQQSAGQNYVQLPMNVNSGEVADDGTKQLELKDANVRRTLTDTRSPNPTAPNAADSKALPTASETVSTTQNARLVQDLRTALRPLTHPVVLITTGSALVHVSTSGAIDGELPELENCRGVTVSSFNTVTLEPKPFVSFNLKLPSRTWDMIEKTRLLQIHLLAATSKAAELAHMFTVPNDDPTTPFRAAVERFGRNIFAGQPHGSPPKMNLPDAVYTHIQARLVKSSTTMVGNHMLVVAEVTHVKTGQGATNRGLGYAMGEYRRLGALVPVATRASLRVTGEQVAANGGSTEWSGLAVEDSALQKKDPDALASVRPDTCISDSEIDDAQRSMTTTETKPTEEAFVDYFQTAEEYEHDEPESDLLVDETQAGSAYLAPEGSLGNAVQDTLADETLTTPTTDRDAEAREEENARRPLRESATRSAPTSTQTTSSDSVRQPVENPWSVPAKRAYSTQSRYRLASCSSTQCYSSTHSPSPAADLNSKVTRPALLTQTIGEFLGQPTTWVPPPPMRALLRARKEAAAASRELQHALSNGSLTEAESLRLERIISINERRVAKKLAMQSAGDLRRMLDDGKVDYRRAQYMESAIEKGMVVVVDEARQARQMYDTGKMDEVMFGRVKDGLEREHAVLNTEAMRLRGMVDEDEEGADETPGAEVDPERTNGDH